MNDIVIEVSGGVVVGVYTDLPDARVVLVDWDNIGDGDRPGIYGQHHLREVPEETRAKCASALGDLTWSQAGM